MPPEPSVTSASGRPGMHLEVLVGAVAEQLRAARPEVGEPGDELLGGRGGGWGGGWRQGAGDWGPAGG